MSRHVITALSLVVSVFTCPAFAVTVKNLDETDHKVVVVEGSSTQDLIVKPGASLEGICLKGCLIKLDDGADDPYELEGTEITTIEKGQLWGEDQEPPVPTIESEPDGKSPPDPQP
jgi:hypothetical protein